MKDTPPDQLTQERIFSDLSMLVYSIVFLFIGVILFEPTKAINYFTLKDFIGLGFTILSMVFFLFLFIDISSYYLARSWTWFRVHFEKFRLYYYLSGLLLFLIALFCVAYQHLSGENFWMIFVGTIASGILAAIGYVLKKIWDSRKKKKEKTSSSE